MYATLVITPRISDWARRVSTAHPDATLHVVAPFPGENESDAIVRVVGPNPQETIESLRDHPQIAAVTPVRRADGEASLRLTVSPPCPVLAAERPGVTIEMPIQIERGTVTVDVVGSREEIFAFSDRLIRSGMEIEIEYVRPEPERMITDRQQELLLAAVESGYYDTPRGCTLTELAEHLDIVTSTCSDVLHRAEGSVIKGYVDLLDRSDRKKAAGRP